MKSYLIQVIFLFVFYNPSVSQNVYGIYRGCYVNYASAPDYPESDQYSCVKRCYSNNFLYSAQKNGTSECYCANSGTPSTLAYNDTQCNCPDYSCSTSSNYVRVSQIFDGSINCPSKVSVNQPFECELKYQTINVGAQMYLVFNDPANTITSFILTNPSSFYPLSAGYPSKNTYHVYVHSNIYVYPAFERYIDVYSGYLFGSISIPYRIANSAQIYESSDYDFILFNSQLRYTGLLKFIEFYGAQSGFIEIDIFKCLKCGTNQTCGDYLLTSSLNISDFVQLNYHTFKIIKGYNLLKYDFVVREGFLFRVKYVDDGTGLYTEGSLALNIDDTSPNAYSDYVFSQSFAKVTNPNAILSDTVNFYFREGVNNIPPKIALSCENNTYDVYQLVYCNVSTYSVNETNRILVDYNDGLYDIFNTTGSNQAYTGMNISAILNNNNYITMSNGTYLLTNTEILNDYYYVAGIELIGAKAGNISLSIVQFSDCGSATSCTSYFQTTSLFSSTYQIYDIGTFNIQVGYNKLMLDHSFQREKGFMILLNQTSDGRVVIENATATASSTWFSDYSIIVDALNLTSLNNSNASFENGSYYANKQNYRFCLSIIIEDSFYVTNFTFVKNYTNASSFNLQVSFFDYTFTPVSASSVISVYPFWSEWSPYWQLCTRTRNYTDTLGNLLMETNVIVDCSYALTANESEYASYGIIVDREAELEKIRVNTQAELMKLDEYYKTRSKIGMAFGSLNVLVMIGFAVYLVAHDMFQILSVCKLVKPIRYPKVNRKSRLKKFDKKNKADTHSNNYNNNNSHYQTSQVKMKPLKAPISQFKKPSSPTILVNEIQIQQIAKAYQSLKNENITIKPRSSLDDSALKPSNRTRSVSPRSIKLNDYIDKFKS